MKKLKTMAETTHEREADQISELPESIIHHIMSFLSMKDLALFGAMSNSFFSAYLSSPTLDFGYDSFTTKYKPTRPLSTKSTSLVSTDECKSTEPSIKTESTLFSINMFLDLVSRTLDRRRRLLITNDVIVKVQRLSFVGPIFHSDSSPRRAGQ